MGLRKLIPSGKRSRPDKPAAASAPGSDAERALGRAQLLTECTRTILRAPDERELARALPDLLIKSAIYAEASVELTRAGDRRKNSALRLRKLRADQITLPLVTDGRTVAVLRLRTSGKRLPDEGELEQLQMLANDAACAIGRLQEDARRNAIAASERGLRETFEHAGVGITRISVDGHFVEVNQKFCDMVGYTREELIGRSTRDITVPEDYGPGAAFRAAAAQGRATVSIAEKRYVHKDGSHVWVRRTITPAYDESRAVRDVISVVECITERKTAEEAVRSERTLLRTIIDALPHYIYVKNDQSRFTLANKAWLDWRGLSVEQVHGKTVYDVFPAELARRLEAQDRPILEDGTPLIDREQQLELVAPDGTKADTWSSTTKVPLRDAADNIIGLVGISRDITHSKRAEEAMRRERALLRTIIDALPDYIYVKDTHFRYQLANTAWLRSRRIQPEELPGKTSFDIFPASVAQRLHQQDQAVMEHGIAMLDNEQPIYLLSDDGSEPHGWSSATKVPMRDGEGNIVGVVGISRDITARRRMERERAMEHAVAQVLSESRSVEQTLSRLIRTICEAMSWAYGARWMWDADRNTLRRAEWWCDVEPVFEESDRHHWLELGSEQTGGPVSRAWLEERPTWLSDITRINTFRRRTSCLKFGFRSAYSFPILAHDERVGVLEFFGRDVREPDAVLLQVTGAIANQIGQFIRRKQAEEALQESEQQLRAMFENADVGIAVTGLDMRYLRVNDRFCSIVGYERDELLSMVSFDVNLDGNVERMRETRRQILNAQVASTSVEKQLVKKDRSLVWVSTAVSLVRARDGSPRYFIAVIQDISESKRAAAALKESEERFRQLAHYDILTKLPNRALFYDRLAHSIARAKRNGWVLAVLFIDVDRFKHVNDTFGHAAGDQLLKQVSQRLSGCMRSDDTVGRLSGDEFAIVLSRLGAAEDAAIVAKKIVDALNTPFQLEGAELFVTASIGITVYPSDSTEQDTLIRNADVAMYRAKDRGRNNFQFYTPEMNARTREMLNMEGELRRALDRDEFVLHYQPKVSLTTGRITGVEALLRWRHPERGLVPPGEFIPLLEETGLIVQAGEWVLRTVCAQLKQWRGAGIPAIAVAINLSARQFLAADLAQNIRQILEVNEVSAGLLEIEITESSVMSNAEEAIRTLEYLESLGVKIAIDDFGTGYSSLSYLKRFPLWALKIDRSFVRDITTDPDDATITQAVISMAHSLGLKVVAEGVETEAQLAFLSRYACDEVQGFLFSRPVPGIECGALIADDSRIGIVIDAVKAASRGSEKDV